MVQNLFKLLGSVAILMMATGAWAQSGGITIKTPPLQASDTVTIPIDVHVSSLSITPTAFASGWAGGLAKIHILDASEVDVDSIVPVAGSKPRGPTGPAIVNPFGPRSENLASVPRVFTIASPLAQQSGANIPASALAGLMDLQLHVKNSSPSGNSDVDLTVMLWNLHHLRDYLPAVIVPIQLQPSDMIWVRSSITSIDQFHVAGSNYGFPNSSDPPALDDPNAHWLHLQQPALFGLNGVQGSRFIATFASTIAIGIEHVPEPAAGGLLALGAACASASAWTRRRRRRVA